MDSHKAASVISSCTREFYKILSLKPIDHNSPIEITNWSSHDEILQQYYIKGYYYDDFKFLINKNGALDQLKELRLDPNNFTDKKSIFMSKDSKVIVKIIRRVEKTNFKSFRREYFEYMKTNPSSNISKIYGMFKVNAEKERPVYFIIMENIFGGSDENNEVYDLKGSTYSRFSNNSCTVKKDCEWISKGLKIPKNSYKKLEETLKKDLDFLSRNKLMDYSILINYSNNEVKLGIIDIMTTYDFVKFSEDMFKTLVCKLNKSCVNPSYYKRRLITFIEESVEK